MKRALLPPSGRVGSKLRVVVAIFVAGSAALALALVGSLTGKTTALYQKWKWHTLRPDGILRADANYGYSTVPIHGHGVKMVRLRTWNGFHCPSIFSDSGSFHCPSIFPSSFDGRTWCAGSAR